MSSAIRVLIVDDEAPARAKIARYLAAESDFDVVGEAADGATAVERIRETAPDLVFLDVQMPGLDGFGVVAALAEERPPHVVFVTAHDEYALAAFEVSALDYLLKPVGPDRFARMLARVRQVLAPGRAERATDESAAKIAQLLETLRAGERRYAERILVEADERAVLLEVARIDRVEADRNYVVLHAGGEAHRMRGTIEGLMSRLDPSRFLRANRSEIIRIDAIREIQPWFHGEYRILMADGEHVMWTRRFVERAPDILLRRL